MKYTTDTSVYPIELERILSLALWFIPWFDLIRGRPSILPIKLTPTLGHNTCLTPTTGVRPSTVQLLVDMLNADNVRRTSSHGYLYEAASHLAET